jgi:hypothetical protein
LSHLPTTDQAQTRGFVILVGEDYENCHADPEKHSRSFALFVPSGSRKQRSVNSSSSVSLEFDPCRSFGLDRSFMKSVSPFFKVLALVLALGLGGCYVWKRQQAAAPPPPWVEAKAEETKEKTPALLLSGSKSGAVNLVEPPAVQAPPPAVIQPSKRLMPGSKSMTLIEPEKEPQPEPQESKKP